MESSSRFRRLCMERDALMRRVEKIREGWNAAPPLSVQVSRRAAPRALRTAGDEESSPALEVEKEIMVLRAWLGTYELGNSA